jgi:hypothetical protein
MASLPGVDASIPSNDVTVTCEVARPENKSMSKPVEMVRAEYSMRELLLKCSMKGEGGTELSEQRTENRKLRTENREQKTENREQKTENREQRTENYS